MTAEEQRLKEADTAPAVLETVGAVRQRPAVGGRGTRGLLREWKRLGLLDDSRPGPQPGLPLGRGRTGPSICDRDQALCFAPALWNGRDPILKERLFGLANAEGNHGEDAKELYYYLDATPSHSYLKMLYKYPQCEYPYTRLVEENARRSAQDYEYELIDTAALDGDRYWDVFVEYFKAAPDDILAQISIHNRGGEGATLHVLPQLWFRNTWSWAAGSEKPSLVAQADGSIAAQHASLGAYQLYAEPKHDLLFCDNETNVQRLYAVKAAGYFKDAFHEYIVQGNRDAVNSQRRGTKAAVHYVLRVAGGGGASQIRLRLSARRQARRKALCGFCRCGCGPCARSRRVLRCASTESTQPGRAAGTAAGFRRNDLEQAIL